MNNINNDEATVNHIRSAFFDAGYRPVTLHSDPPERRKHPIDTEWQDHARQTPSPYVTNQATRFALNTGILCDGLRAVDIDVDDAAMVAEIISLAHTMLGAAPVKYRQNSPRVTLPYRAAEGEPAKRSIQNRNTGHKIEVLGRGQQFLAHGVHDSGVPILWTGLRPRDELTAVTEGQITAFLAAAREIIGADESGSGGSGSESEWRAGDLSAVDAALLESIYARLPNHGRFDDRNEWIKLAHATAAAFRRDLWRGQRLFLTHAERFHGPIKEGEADRVWASVTGRDRADQPIPNDAISPHRVGAGYLVQMARETGVEPGLIAAYESAVLLHEGFVAEARPMPTPAGLYRYGDDPYRGREWVVRHAMPLAGVSLIAGQWGAGKTFVGFELAACVMFGLPFCGLAVDTRGGVLWLAAEGEAEVPERMTAALRAHGVGDVAPASVPFAWRDSFPCLTAAGALAEMVRLVRDAAAEMADTGTALRLVIVDTMAASAGWADENSSAEASQVMRVLRGVGRATGTAVVAIDHYGKTVAAGVRGASAKEADAAAVWAIMGDGEPGSVTNRRIRFRKTRSKLQGREFGFDLVPAVIGADEWGHLIETCSVEWLGVARPSKIDIQPMTQRYLDVLAGIIGEDGTVGSDLWETEAVRIGLIGGSGFRGQKSKLVTAGRIRCDGSLVRLI